MARSGSNVLAFRPDTSGGEVAVRYAEEGTSIASRRPDAAEPEQRRSEPSAQAPPQFVPLMDFGDELRLRHPLFVVVEESDGAIVVASYDLEVAEYGDTEFEALEHFKAAVVELHQAINQMGDGAPEHLAAKRRFLDAIKL